MTCTRQQNRQAFSNITLVNDLDIRSHIWLFNLWLELIPRSLDLSVCMPERQAHLQCYFINVECSNQKCKNTQKSTIKTSLKNLEIMRKNLTHIKVPIFVCDWYNHVTNGYRYTISVNLLNMECLFLDYIITCPCLWAFVFIKHILLHSLKSLSRLKNLVIIYKFQKLSHFLLVQETWPLNVKVIYFNSGIMTSFTKEAAAGCCTNYPLDLPVLSRKFM